MISYYPIFKTIHIIGIISWMAGLLYLFRLFIYHFDYGQENPQIHSLLSLMETRLFKYITHPAMIVSTLAGVLMIYANPMLFAQNWFRVKFVCALLMIIVTGYSRHILNRFSQKSYQPYTSKTLRILNEIPTLLMIIIVIMVIIQPFH